MLYSERGNVLKVLHNFAISKFGNPSPERPLARKFANSLFGRAGKIAYKSFILHQFYSDVNIRSKASNPSP